MDKIQSVNIDEAARPGEPRRHSHDQAMPTGEYAVPTNAREARCKSCGAEIYWTTTASHRPIPLSVATVRVDEGDGMRYALVHWADCPHAAEHRTPAGASSQAAKIAFPLTMAFPPGAFVPVFCGHVTAWPDGWLTVTFDERGQLEEDVFVSRLARELGLTGRVVEPTGERGDVVRVEMV